MSLGTSSRAARALCDRSVICSIELTIRRCSLRCAREHVTFAMSINTDKGQNNYCEPIVLRPQEQKEFVLLPKRWVVERTFGWLSWCRRLNRDHECLPATSDNQARHHRTRSILQPNAGWN
jgi:transposase